MQSFRLSLHRLVAAAFTCRLFVVAFLPLALRLLAFRSHGHTLGTSSCLLAAFQRLNVLRRYRLARLLNDASSRLPFPFELLLLFALRLLSSLVRNDLTHRRIAPHRFLVLTRKHPFNQPGRNILLSVRERPKFAGRTFRPPPIRLRPKRRLSAIVRTLEHLFVSRRFERTLGGCWGGWSGS